MSTGAWTWSILIPHLYPSFCYQNDWTINESSSKVNLRSPTQWYDFAFLFFFGTKVLPLLQQQLRYLIEWNQTGLAIIKLLQNPFSKCVHSAPSARLLLSETIHTSGIHTHTPLPERMWSHILRSILKCIKYDLTALHKSTLRTKCCVGQKPQKKKNFY